jgi:hypothetical protein
MGLYGTRVPDHFRALPAPGIPSRNRPVRTVRGVTPFYGTRLERPAAARAALEELITS